MSQAHLKASTTLVVTPKRRTDESLLGYVMRLSESNGFASVKSFIELIARNTGKRVRNPVELVYDKSLLRALEQLANAPADSLVECAWNPIDSASGRHFSVRGAQLPEDALMTAHSQVCPLCVADYGYLREDWDLSAVTVCPEHQIALVDHCPDCHQPLRVVRDLLSACSNCQKDLRYATTVAASDAEVTLAGYIAALAPYRLLQGNLVEVDHAESLFALCQSMSFDTRSILAGQWVEKKLQRQRAEVRRGAVIQVASALRGNAIDGVQLRETLLQHVAHRLPFLPRDLAIQPLQDFLRENAFLSPLARNVLSFGNADLRPLSAAQHFNLNPPQLKSPEDVEAYLGCSPEAMTWLLRHQYLHLPMGDLGFDADELLAAQSRLRQFVTLTELDKAFGVPGLAQSLVDWNVLPASTTAWDIWTSVDLVVVGRILDALRLHTVPSSQARDFSWVRLRDIFPRGMSSAERYAIVIARALRADLTAVQWCHPYSFEDLWVAPKDAIRLNSAS